MKTIKINWKVSAKPNKVVQKAAAHFTFRTCTTKCGA